MKKLLFLLFILSANYTFSQEPLLISGPMLGYSEHRSVLIWYEVSQDVRSASIRYWEKDNVDFYYEHDYEGVLGKPYNPIRFELVKLKMNTIYSYEIILNGKAVPFPNAHTFKTKALWEFRSDPPDFSFLAGSGAYLKDEATDPPGHEGGKDASIFTAMALMPADFMLWLGNNLYLQRPDYSSAAGIRYRYSRQRRNEALSLLLSSKPNYAIWDDHDYGPDDSHAAFELKSATSDIFREYWGNQSYGEPGNTGIYSKFTWSDCDFILTDDRSFRNSDKYPDSSDGKPDCSKNFFGWQQLSWIQQQLISSSATFKFIVCGNQVLNAGNKYECMRNYSCEFNDLISFIVKHKIPGVVFLSGDRHFSEVIKHQPKGGYPLYDITSSPLTSVPVDITGKAEEENPQRVQGTLVSANTYAKISIAGSPDNRVLQVQNIDSKGTVRGQFQVPAASLQFP